MEEHMKHFQYIMIHYFKKGRKCNWNAKKICEMYGEDAMTDQMCQKWLTKFVGTIDIFAK